MAGGADEETDEILEGVLRVRLANDLIGNKADDGLENLIIQDEQDLRNVDKELAKVLCNEILAEAHSHTTTVNYSNLFIGGCTEFLSILRLRMVTIG